MRLGAFCPVFLVYLTMLFQLFVRMFVNNNLEGPVCLTMQQISLNIRGEESKLLSHLHYFDISP